MAEPAKVLQPDTETAISLFLARWAPLDTAERTTRFVAEFKGVLEALMDDLGAAYERDALDRLQRQRQGLARTLLDLSRHPGERGGTPDGA